MKSFRYVTLDPTGNITCLVLDPVEESERNRVTSALMEQCEQVGYLQKPHQPKAKASLQMMGGEFCGNATMAAASYLAQQEGETDNTVVLLEVSGANELVSCAVTPLTDDLWEGTVKMPSIQGIRPLTLGEYDAVLVRMEGIAHLILQDIRLDAKTAETLLLTSAGELPDASVGLLQWNSRTNYMKPLVFVKKSGTLVWETGCGSGSTAIGAWLASKKRDGILAIDIQQPGGIIRAEAEANNGLVTDIRITGRVRIGKTETLCLEG